MQFLWNKLDRPALSPGSADQFILADEQDQILDQLSELRLEVGDRLIACSDGVTQAGLGDYTCPPSGVTVLYNNIPGPKKIKYIQGADHGFNPPGAQVFEMESK